MSMRIESREASNTKPNISTVNAAAVLGFHLRQRKHVGALSDYWILKRLVDAERRV